MIKENKLAPNFKIPSSNNKEFELKKNKDKFLLIYFYPKDNTPGCTIEAKDFSKLYKNFKKLNCEVAYKMGAETAINLIETLIEENIEEVTFYALSKDNFEKITKNF